jgi:hypothetical protein
MKRQVVLWLIVLIGTTSVTAQQRRPVQESDYYIKGEDRLQWVIERLDLKPDQKQHVEGALMDIYRAECAAEAADNGVALMREIQEAFGRLQEARIEGDPNLIAKRQAELMALSPGARPEKHFFESLEQVLDSGQKQKLPLLREQVKTVMDEELVKQYPPDKTIGRTLPVAGEPQANVSPPPATPAVSESSQPPMNQAFKPVHVLLAAKETGLSTKQLVEVEAALAAFRSELVASPPKSAQEREDRVKQLVGVIRPILNADQQRRFDKRIGEQGGPVPAQASQLPTETSSGQQVRWVRMKDLGDLTTKTKGGDEAKPLEELEEEEDDEK